MFSPAGISGAMAQTDCHLRQLESLDMDTDPDGTVTVPVTISNRPARLMIDIGAARSIIDESFARSLDIDPRPMRGRFMVLGGGIPLWQTAVADSLMIGQIAAPGFEFVVAPSRTLTPRTMGMLGADVMGRYDVELDFAGSKFNIFSQKHCSGDVVYWTQTAYATVPMQLDNDNHVFISVTLDGKAFSAAADTGSARSFMSLDLAKEIFGIDEKNPALKSMGRVGINNIAAEQQYQYPFHSLTFGGVEVKEPDIAIMKAPTPIKGQPQLLIGIGVLRQLHLYISYREHLLYVTPAEAH